MSNAPHNLDTKIVQPAELHQEPISHPQGKEAATTPPGWKNKEKTWCIYELLTS